MDQTKTIQTNTNNSSSKKFSLYSLIPTQYIFIGSVVLIGLINMYKGVFRFSFGFFAGTSVGVVLGFVFADSPIGQRILKLRSKQQT